MLKGWVVRLLSIIIVGYVFFACTTIDTLGNKTYNIIFATWTGLALVSYYLLKKYSKIF